MGILADGTQVGWNGIGGVPFYAPNWETGSLRLPDTRGMYSEDAGFDGLGVGMVHGDMIRPATGNSRVECGAPLVSSSILYRNPNNAPRVELGVETTVTGEMLLDISRAMPVGNKIAPAHSAFSLVSIWESLSKRTATRQSHGDYLVAGRNDKFTYFVDKAEDYGLLPNNATYTAPKKKAGHISRWDGKKWKLVKNHKGETGYVNGKAFTVTEYGPYPTGWSEAAPEPTQAEIDEQRRVAIRARLEEVEASSVRPLRAVWQGNAGQANREKLAALEAEAETLRAELAALI